MALFNRKKKKQIKFDTIEFNKQELDRHLEKVGRKLYSIQKTETSIVFLTFLKLIRNKALLNLASSKDEGEYMYRKGLHDSIDQLLQVREYYLEKTKQDMKKEEKKKTSSGQKSYFNRKTTQAGLSI